MVHKTGWRSQPTFAAIKNVTANIFSSESIDFVFCFYYIVVAGYRYTGILIKPEAKHILAEQNVRNQRIS